MSSDALGGRASPLLRFGAVDLVRVQVGYRTRPGSHADLQFLLDLPVPEADAHDGRLLDEQALLTGLEPVLYLDAETPRHYSLHQHRWHTSWGASPGVLEIGLLVTTGTGAAAIEQAATDVVIRAFHDLLATSGTPDSAPIPRDAAVLRARRGAATAFGLDADALSLSAEQHDHGRNAWSVALRTGAGDEVDVVVGLVDGYAGALRLRHVGHLEVHDSVGAE